MPKSSIVRYHLTATIELSAEDMYGKPVSGSASIVVEKSINLTSLSEFGVVLQYLENIPSDYNKEV